ncbi:MAG: DNA primase [Candidatus Kaiserbacteria bacterium]|nr:DNA primase [Candidatus Kaiserbacteria bacterium]
MTDTVAQIKERLTIQDIVAPYVKLTKAGKSLVGLCPFHKEKTASFHVSLDRGTWHCFGCGLGGDGFSFIEKVEGVDFKGALKILAEKAGVQITTIYGSGGGKEDVSKKDRLREVISRASEWYAGKLVGSPAETYAKQRGLSKETIHSWRLGYAPDAWRALLEALSAEGFTVQELLAAGLIKEADGKTGTFYDRFRNRLMFPITDNAGRVVAFTGRALSADDQAKYLNSPETELYHKSEILFGIDRAKDAIRTRKFALLVEGQMDVLLAHQIGFENAIALSGTALSEKHLALIKRYSENLLLVLDADTAGLSATARSAALALSRGLQVKAARLPKGKDPAELISGDTATGKKEFSKYITAAKPIVEFFLVSLTERERDPHRLISAAERIILPLIAAMQSPMEREHFIQITARTLGLSNEAVRDSLTKLPRASVEETVTMKDSVTVIKRSARQNREETLLAVVHAYPDTPLAERVKTRYLQITEADQLPADAPVEPALFEAERLFGKDPEEDAADELLRVFEELVVREAYQEAVTHLRRIESSGDAKAIESAQAQCAKISTRLAVFG